MATGGKTEVLAVKFILNQQNVRAICVTWPTCHFHRTAVSCRYVCPTVVLLTGWKCDVTPRLCLVCCKASFAGETSLCVATTTAVFCGKVKLTNALCNRCRTVSTSASPLPRRTPIVEVSTPPLFPSLCLSLSLSLSSGTSDSSALGSASI